MTFSPSLGYTWIFVGLKEAMGNMGKPMTLDKTKDKCTRSHFDAMLNTILTKQGFINTLQCSA